MRKPMEIFVGSGKGGVGKSMLTASLALFASKSFKVLCLDADADAPNLALWLGGVKKWDVRKKLSTSQKPVIDPEKCQGCGKCVSRCPFSALELKNQKATLIPFICEGCGLCAEICPYGAIKMKPAENGFLLFKKELYPNLDLISSQLLPGETGSGKIVDKMKEEAEKWRKGKDLVFVDSAPGTGCPVNAALKGANVAVLITEPTPSGVADLENLLKVVEHFRLPWFLVINKATLNSALTKKLEELGGSKLLGKISYQKEIFSAISQLKPIPFTSLKAKEEISQIYKNLLEKLKIS